MDRRERQTSPARRSLKRKLEQDFEEKPDRKVSIVESDATQQDLVQDIRAQIDILNSKFSSDETDRAAAKTASHALVEFAKNGTVFDISILIINIYVTAQVYEGVVCLCCTWFFQEMEY